MTTDASRDFSSASASEPGVDLLWQKAQDALASTAVQGTTRVTTTSHFFGCPPEDISPNEFVSDIKAPSVVAFIRTRNKVFSMTCDTPSYDYDKNGDTIIIGLQHLDDDEKIRHQISTCQITTGCVILTDFPANKALEIMNLAVANGRIPRPLPREGHSAESHMNAIEALRREIQPSTALEYEPQVLRYNRA